MTINQEFITKKISQSGEYLAIARSVLTLSDKEILSSIKDLTLLERYFQLTVEVILDINNHIIKEANLNLADNLKSTFKIMADGNILDKEFAQKFSDIVGLRNKIVHDYEKIDTEQFVTDFRKHNSDFDEYFKQIVSYLDKTNLPLEV